VLNSASSDDEGADRPRSHWVVITAAFTLSLWVPLSLVAHGLGRRLALLVVGATDATALPGAMAHASKARAALAFAALVLPVIVAFMAACFASGALAGRYGGRTRARDAAVGTALAAFAAFVLALAGGALRPWPVALGTLILLGFVALLFGALGGRFGQSRRPQL
jgi:hypothetical protein